MAVFKRTFAQRTFSARTFASRTWGPRAPVVVPTPPQVSIWPAGPSPEQLREERLPEPRRPRYRRGARIVVSLGGRSVVSLRDGDAPRPAPAVEVYAHAALLRLGIGGGATWRLHDPNARRRREEDEWLLGVR